MQAVVRESGSRPTVNTPAIQNALPGAKALADIMAEKTFADMCIITVDWDGDGFTPVLNVFTVKFFIEYNGQRLEHAWPIDLNEAFGQNNVDRSILLQIANDLEEHFEDMTNKRRAKDMN